MFDTKECEANRLHNVLTLLKHIICLKGRSLIYIQQAPLFLGLKQENHFSTELPR